MLAPHSIGPDSTAPTATAFQIDRAIVRLIGS
jgi:hypothetical protein